MVGAAGGNDGHDSGERRRQAAGGGLSVRTVRRVVLGVCVVGIAGMIVSSVGANTPAALTFGLVTAVAVLCLIVATAVAGSGAPAVAPPDDLPREEERGGAA